MKQGIIKAALIVTSLLLSASMAIAAETKAATAADAKAGSDTKDAAKSAKAAKAAKAPANVKLVDINSASKAELKTLPGIGDAEADKIIAGRPYLSKANLTTQNIVSREIYDALRTLVIARQNKASEAKLEAKAREKQQAAAKPAK